MFSFKLGLRSLIFRKRQYISLFLVCLVGVGISLFSIFLMDGMLYSLRMKAKIYYGGDLQFIGGTDALFIDDYEHIIQELEDVFPKGTRINARYDFDAASAAFYFEGKETRQRVVKGVDFSKEQEIFKHFNFESGSPDSIEGTNGILLSKPIADMLNARVGDEITFVLTTVDSYMNTINLVVKGIFNDSSLFGMYTSYMDFELLKEVYGIPKQSANRITINFSNGEPTKHQLQFYQSLLEKKFQMFPLTDDKYTFYDGLYNDSFKETTYALITLDANLKEVKVLIDAMHALASFIITVLGLIIILGVSSTYRVLILKRCNEIGIYMAIGMSRNGIRRVLLSETIFLLITGCIAGSLFSIFLSQFIQIWDFSFIPAFDIFLSSGNLIPILNVKSAMLLIFSIIFTTVIAVLFAIKKAVSMTPVQALNIVD